MDAAQRTKMDTHFEQVSPESIRAERDVLRIREADSELERSCEHFGSGAVVRDSGVQEVGGLGVLLLVRMKVPIIYCPKVTDLRP